MMSFEDELLFRFWRTWRQRTGHRPPAGVVHPDEDEQLWERLAARTEEAIEEARRRRAVAEELRDEILSFEPAERSGRLTGDPRFHSDDLLELLLDESQTLQATDPDAATFWGQMAGQLAEVLRDKSTLGSDSQVRAGVLRGNALRLAGDLEGAGRAFTAASAHLEEDSAEVPVYARSLGVLRWEQHRLAEAVSLLEHAARLSLSEELEADAGLSLLLLGVLHGETCAPERGLSCLLQGHQTVSPPQPWLNLRGGFLLSARLVELGELPIARTVLDETMELYKLIREEHETLCGYRLEAAARARLGEIGRAEDLLQGVRHARLSKRHLPELVLTSLDLAVVLVELGRDHEIEQLAADVQGFEPEEGGVFAIEAFELFRSFRSEGRNLRRSAAGAAAEFRRLCRLFTVPMAPLPFVV